MYLEKLVVQGFKSFAHKTTLEFPPPKRGRRGIAAIVGPNGSGKSNLADAIRWVLGEQSMKLLRGKKAEDVIFAGSDKKTRLGLAEASLHLNNADHSAAIDYSEVVITRRVLRNGEGEYFLNRTPVRLHDILLFLAKANFGQRTYSIIGQGTVDEVLLQTPAARKEFFDEAAGVRAFQIKREQAVSKLDLTKENLNQVSLLIQEIAPRLRSLTRQVKRLEQRETVANELLEAQKAYYVALAREVGGKLKTARDRLAIAEAEKSDTTKRSEQLQTEINRWRGQATRHDEFSKLQTEYQKLIDARNALLRERASVKGKIDSEAVAAGEANVVWLERKAEELESDRERLGDERKQAESRLTKLRERLLERESVQKTIAEKLNSAQAKLRQSQDVLTKRVMTLPELRQQVERAFGEQQSFLDRLQAATSVDDLARLKTEALRIRKSLEAFLEDVRSQIPEASPEAVKKLQEAVQQILGEKDRILHETADLKVESEVFGERVEALRERIDAVGEERESVQRELEASKTKGKDRGDVLKAQLADLDRKLGEQDAALKASQEKLARFNESAQAKQDDLLKLQRELAEAQDTLRQASDRASDSAVEVARLETRNEDLEREMNEEILRHSDEVKRLAKESGEPANTEALHRDIQKLKEKLDLIGGIDPQIGQEYTETKGRHDFLSTQHADLTKAIADLEVGIEHLDETIKKQFDESFVKINEEFGKYFKILFAGGRASLELIREELVPEGAESVEGETEAAEEAIEPMRRPRGPKVVTGIEIHATPPGKRLKSINMLSGGERALTSIALICAIIANNPAPFVVLDEVDAALDEANSIRFAQIVEQLAQQTQFIVVTHNRATMERADVLYGVTMTDDGVSHLLSVKMEEAEKVISAHGNR